MALRRWLSYTFIVVLIILLVLIICLPSIIEKPWGRNAAADLASSFIPGRIKADSIKLNWLGGQSIDDVTLYGPNGTVAATCKRLYTDSSLISLIWHSSLDSKSGIEGLSAILTAPEHNGDTVFNALSKEPKWKFFSTQKDSPAGHFPPVKAVNVNIEVDPDAKNGMAGLELSGRTEKGPEHGYFKASIAAKEGTGSDSLSKAALSGNLRLTGKASNFPTTILDCIATAYSSKWESLPSVILGDSLNFYVEDLPEGEYNHFSLNLATPKIDATAVGEATKEGFTIHAELRQGGRLLAPILPGLVDDQTNMNLSMLKTADGTDLKLTVSSDIKLPSLPALAEGSLSDLTIQISGPTLAESKIQATATINENGHPSQKELSQIPLGSISLTLDPPDDGYHFEKLGPLKFKGALLLGNSSSMPRPAEPSSLIGNIVDIHFIGQLWPKERLKGWVNLAIKGDKLDGKAAFVIDESITLKGDDEDAFLQFTLTPDRFSAMRKWLIGAGRRSGLTLQAPSLVRLSMHSLDIPIKHLGASNPLAHSSADLTLLVDKLRIKDNLLGQTLSFDSITAKAAAKQLDRLFSFSLEGGHETSGHYSQTLSVSGKLKNLLNDQGGLNYRGVEAALHAEASQLPASVLINLSGIAPGAGQKVDVLFGDLVDAKIHLGLKHLKGSLQAQIQGAAGAASLDGYIENGSLKLKSPFEAVTTVTPELGANLLQNIVPILEGTLTAENALKITILPEGFNLPLRELDFRDIQLGQAKIELGKVYFKNEGQLAQILSLFNSPGNEQILVWFTPIYLQMNSGVLRLERTDMLINNTYPIALWGSIDLPRQWINMMIGLSAEALQRAFKVPIPDRKYMMALPFKGKIGEASIDKTKVTARITALIAQLSGTPQGLVIGTVLQFASNMNESPVPSPTTNPLPWNNEKQYSSENEPTGNFNGENAANPEKFNPLKQLQKGAGSFLNNLNPFR